MKYWTSQVVQKHKFDLAPVAVLLLLPLVVYWNVFFAVGPFPRIYPIENDFAHTYIALGLAVQLLRESEVGLWFPYIRFGAPYLGNPLSGTLYPATILPSKFTDPENVLSFNEFSLYLHMTTGITACFFYFFMRSIKTNRWGSLIGAIVWGFNLRFADIIRTPDAAHTIMWLPLLVLVTIKIVRGAGRVRYVSYFALLLATAYFAGYPANFVYSMGFLILLSVYLLIDEQATLGRRRLALSAISMVAAIGLGFCLMAVQLAPALEFAANYNRRDGLPFAETMIYRCAPLQTILGFLFPAVAYTERDHYAGLLPLMLALLGLFCKDERYQLKKLLVFTMVITCIYSTESALSHPLQKFAYDYIPLFNGLRCPGRTLILSMFSIAMPCGYGMDALTWLQPIRTNIKRLTCFIAVVVAGSCIVVLILPKSAMETLSSTDRHVYIAFAVLSLVLLSVLAFGQRRASLMHAFAFLAAVVITADLMVAVYRKNVGPHAGHIYYSQKEPGITGARSQISKALNEEYYRIPPRESERIGRIGSLMFHPLLFVNSALPNFDAPWSIFGYEQSLFATNYFFIRTRDSWQVRSLYNTRFDADYFLPRAYVVYQLEKCSEGKIIERMLSEKFDPLNKHYIEEDAPTNYRSLLTEGSETDIDETGRLRQIGEETRMTRYSYRQVEIEVDISKAGFLFMSDTFFPGWRCFIDGESTRIYRTDFLFGSRKCGKGILENIGFYARTKGDGFR